MSPAVTGVPYSMGLPGTGGAELDPLTTEGGGIVPPALDIMLLVTPPSVYLWVCHCHEISHTLMKEM